ncbi:MAG: hypothetical protein OXL36_09015 [Bryobacterales bacterium]|nr:hypothetical protein [Bryobacterales bacterium]MDE0293029.1 hypothetical protein [Bryobacterales bacterium]
MTPITQSARQRYEQAGSLAEELPYWGWVDPRTLLTRPGGLLTLAELHPCGIAGSSPEDLDHVLASWMRLLGQLDEDVRFSLIVTRRPVGSDAVAAIGSERLPAAIFESRAEEIVRRSGELRFYAAWTLDSRLQEARQKGGVATSWLKRLTSNGKAQRLYVQESIARAAERLLRIVDASRGLVTDVCPSTVLEEQQATAVLGEMINRPGTVAPVHEGGALHWAWGLSQLEGHRRHLTLDDEPLAIYSIVEPPPKATANILWELLTLRATWTWVWEWQGLSIGKARGIMRSAQKHFFSSRYSMMAHARGTEGTDVALLDSAAAAESAALGDALVELQSEGIPWGRLAASLSIHAPDLQLLEELDSSVVKIFTGRDIKILREGWGQLSAWFGRLPGQAPSRQLRRMPVSAGTALCCSAIFAPGHGEPESDHLEAPSLATLETRCGTLYDYDLFAGSDVGHSLVLGSTGAGKSFLLNFLLVHSLRYNPRVAILDLGGSYRHLTAMLGGSYLRLDGTGDSTPLRPFTLPENERTYEFLTGWVTRLLKLGGYETTGDDTTEIRRRLEDVYGIAAGKRRMSSLVETLPPRMKAAMTRWVQGGQWGKIFDVPGEDAEIAGADWQVVDLAGARDFPDLVAAALSYCLERLRLELERPEETTRLKILVVDEAWRFLAEPATANYLAEAARTWRKRNAALILATQSVSDVVGGAATGALIESIPNRLFLSIRDLTYQAAAKLQLSDAETSLIQNLIPKREVYARNPNSREVLTLNVDKRSYWMFTSNPIEEEKRAAAIKRTGDLEQAIEDLARGS